MKAVLVAAVLGVLVGVATAQGGARGGRSVRTYYGGGSGNEGLEPPPTWVIVVLVTFTLSICMCCCFVGYSSKDGRPRCPASSAVKCYLCKKRVSEDDWHSHRQKCSNSHATMLETLPMGKHKVKCPKCKRFLRLWPAGLGPPFRCDAMSCTVIGEIETNGYNRYNCFRCDYDLCGTCVEKTSKSNSSTEDPPNPSKPEGSRQDHHAYRLPRESPYRDAPPPTYDQDYFPVERAPGWNINDNPFVEGPQQQYDPYYQQPNYGYGYSEPAGYSANVPYAQGEQYNLREGGQQPRGNPFMQYPQENTWFYQHQS